MSDTKDKKADEIRLKALLDRNSVCPVQVVTVGKTGKLKVSFGLN